MSRSRRVLIVGGSREEAEEARARLEEEGFTAEAAAAPPAALAEDPRLERLQNLQRLASLGSLVATTAHELANIISRLQVNLHALERRGKAGELTDAMACADQLAELGRDLTGYAQARPPAMRPTSVRAILERALRLVAHRLGVVALETSYEDELPPIRADGDRLRQVFVNLLHNALDAMAEPSTSERRLALRVSAEGDQVRIDVEDSGHGVPAEVLPHVFEMFFSTKRREDGTGIGLSVSREIVRSHGGDLTASSEPGKGSTFSVLLPALAP